MATKFNVSTDQLLTASNAYNGRRSTVLGLIQQVIGLGSTLQGSWQGQAASTYYRKLCDIRGDLNDVNKAINEHVQDLMEIARAYATTEEQVNARNNSLQSDVISYP